jgi:hypothetical protein
MALFILCVKKILCVVVLFSAMKIKSLDVSHVSSCISSNINDINLR